jgi:hypothetical protein
VFSDLSFSLNCSLKLYCHKMFVKMAPKSKKCVKLCIPPLRSRKDARRQKFSPDHPPPRRRQTYQRSIHMLNFTYEDDIKIKNKHVAGISRTFYLVTETISRLPQSRETIPLRSTSVQQQIKTFLVCIFVMISSDEKQGS